MEAKYGDTTICWEKSLGHVSIHSIYYNQDCDWEDLDEDLTLFEFLSRLGITARQVEKAFADEDME